MEGPEPRPTEVGGRSGNPEIILVSWEAFARREGYNPRGTVRSGSLCGGPPGAGAPPDQGGVVVPSSRGDAAAQLHAAAVSAAELLWWQLLAAGDAARPEPVGLEVSDSGVPGPLLGGSVGGAAGQHASPSAWTASVAAD